MNDKLIAIMVIAFLGNDSDNSGEFPIFESSEMSILISQLILGGKL